MKKVVTILISLIIIGAISIYCLSNNNDKVDVQDIETIVTKEENISYEELLTYVSNFNCGDIINIENTNYLSSYAIPGRWKHSLLYLGAKDQVSQVYNETDKYYKKIMSHYKTGDELLLIDSNNTGVKIRELNQMANLKEESYLKALIVQRLDTDANTIKTYLNKALDYYNTPYDYSLETYNTDALYCSELVYYSLKSINIKINQKTDILNHIMITPLDVVESLNKLDICHTICLLEKQNNQVINVINN